MLVQPRNRQLPANIQPLTYTYDFILMLTTFPVRALYAPKIKNEKTDKQNAGVCLRTNMQHDASQRLEASLLESCKEQTHSNAHQLLKMQ